MPTRQEHIGARRYNQARKARRANPAHDPDRAGGSQLEQACRPAGWQAAGHRGTWTAGAPSWQVLRAVTLPGPGGSNTAPARPSRRPLQPICDADRCCTPLAGLVRGKGARGRRPPRRRCTYRSTSSPTEPAELAALATAVSTPGNPVVPPLSYRSRSSRPASGRAAESWRPWTGTCGERACRSARFLQTTWPKTSAAAWAAFEQAFATPLARLRTRPGRAGGRLRPRHRSCRPLGELRVFIEGLYPWVSPSNDLVRFPAPAEGG